MKDNLVKVAHSLHIFLGKFKQKSYTRHSFFVNISTAGSIDVSKKNQDFTRKIVRPEMW